MPGLADLILSFIALRVFWKVAGARPSEDNLPRLKVHSGLVALERSGWSGGRRIREAAYLGSIIMMFHSHTEISNLN